MLADGGEFTLRANTVARKKGDAGSYFATCYAFTRGGLEVPLELLFTGEGDAEGLDPEKAAQDIVDTLCRLQRQAESHEKRKADLHAAIEREVAHAGSLGVELKLLRITELSVDVSHPNRRHAVYFDVSMGMLNDKDLRLDCYTMEAAEGEEFGLYLRDNIIPEQQAIHARRQAELGIPAAANG